MLEWEVASGEQTQLEIIAALQGTSLGQKCYKELCERQKNLQRLVKNFFVFEIPTGIVSRLTTKANCV